MKSPGQARMQRDQHAADQRPATGQPLRVLFACVGNSARSQMAQGFAMALGGDRVEARSGGSKPLGHVLPEAIAAMRENGIDISGHPSRGFDEDWVRSRCDLVVTMGCGDDACPAFVGKPMVDWDLDDPKGKPLAEFRRVRDEIEVRVRDLLRARGIVVATPN
jgi:protein-tyrosine-phosphatase